MAKASPMSQVSTGLSNVNYDLISTLAQDLESIDVLNTYVEDCQKAGDQEAERIFAQIRDDELRHCQMLRQLVEERCRQGQFR